MEQLHLRLIHKGVILRGSNGIRNDVFDLAHADSLREGNEKTALPVPLTITMAGLGASQRPTGEQCRLSLREYKGGKGISHAVKRRGVHSASSAMRR